MKLLGIEVWCRGIGGGIVLIGPMKDFLFVHTRVSTGDLWISSPVLYYCATATSGFHLWDWWWYCSDWTCERFSFLPTPGFELGTSGSLVLNYTSEPQWFLVFTSDNFRYWSLVQRDWWWYCSDWTHERFSFFQTSIWTGDLWISSPALYLCATVTSVFHL